MVGFNSSAPRLRADADAASPLDFTVHSMPLPAFDDAARRTARGRRSMLIVLLVCAAPVVASYLAYFVIRPAGRTNYSEFIEPVRPLPADLRLVDLQGTPFPADALRGQWLLIVVSGGACNASCEAHLWLQRQLREALGREKDRLDKVWLISDAVTPRSTTLAAVTTHTQTTVLRVARHSLSAWLEPARGQALEDHLYIVDPLGNWMMRVPAHPEPGKLKRDVDKLLRASAGWDRPGR